MKILWLSHLLPYPPKGGVQQRSYNLLREVASQHEVWLLAFNQVSLLPKLEQIEEARHELKKICKGVEVVNIPSDASRWRWLWLVVHSLFTLAPYTLNWLKSQEMRNKLREQVGRTRFDLIHFDTISLAVYAGDVGATPKVLNHHNIESDMMYRRSMKDQNVLKKSYLFIEANKLRSCEKRLAPEFDLNFTVSDLDRQRLVSIAPGIHTAVIPNGTDTSFFSPSRHVHPKPKSLIFAGGMKWYPNRDAMLFFFREVWPLLKKVEPESTFTVIGRLPPPEIVQLSQTDKSIKVAGFVEDVRPLIAEAEIYVCPIRDGGGTRLKILDALAMGKALVSTSIGYEGLELVPEHDLLVADTPVEFVKQIKRLMEDHGLRERLQTNGLETIRKKYGWEHIGQELKRCLCEFETSRSLKTLQEKL
ncbi:MAG: glycosyltransferase family 4 protein [Nitrospirota bacterium]